MGNSDHNQIIVQVEKQTKNQARPFKFKPQWLEEGFLELAKNNAFPEEGEKIVSVSVVYKRKEKGRY